MKIKFFLALIIACLSTPIYSAINYYSVADYRGRADNPIYLNSGLRVSYLEDFEPPRDALSPNLKLNTPQVTGWNGSTTGGASRGVAEDSKSSDPDGGLGYTWNTAFRLSAGEKAPLGIHFDFTPDSSGRLPEYVGAALLGKYDLQNLGGLYNSIFVFDRNGLEITGGDWRIPKPLLSDPLPEDPSDFFMHFEGIYYSGGISRIHFRDFVEVDHLTYGYAIPEPGVAWLAAAASLRLLHRRRMSR